ncbi:hypothetical protein PR048_020084 [Dryococelus australis]|uniref:Uncharacterized protein n=1 Tax=Dryococelus australis TaxID=614101 RepID=A0ABQ9H5C4_9NEOP|nr:hypothetical protein PR048_020084 [Dryococelus australis]
MISETKETADEDIMSKSSYEDILQKLICKHFGNSNHTVKVKDVQDVVQVGNNYLNCLHRISLEILKDNRLEEEKVLIVKVFPEGELLQQFIREEGIFETEITVYNNILPEINKVALNVLGISKFSANHFETGDNNMTVLEDLRLAGYKMADRYAGLNFYHCNQKSR